MFSALGGLGFGGFILLGIVLVLGFRFITGA